MNTSRVTLIVRNALILVFFMLTSVALLAVPPLTFQINNLLSSDRTGPWTVDYDDLGVFFQNDGSSFTFATSPTYLYHDYAYRLFGADASTTSSCVAENIAAIDGTAGITSEFVNFSLVGFNKINTVNPSNAWNISGQAGDHRVYANGQVLIKLNGITKLTILNTQIHVYTPYPTAAQIRLLNPGLTTWLSNIGSGAAVTAWGFGTIDMLNSDAAWAAEVGDPVNHQVRYDLKNIAYALQFPPSTARYTYQVELTPVAAPVNLVSVTPVQGVDIVPANSDIKVNFSSLALGGAAGNLADLSIILIKESPAKAFAYANKYWQISTTLSNFTASLTFDVAGESLGSQANWVIYRRINLFAPWTEWSGGTTIVDATHIRADNVTAFSDWTVGTLDDVTLPVEMQSFTAVVNAQDFVSLRWVTGSETNLNGYNVYRADQGSFANANSINMSLITASNTSNIATYSFVDRDVTANSSYYYWLESVEMSGESSIYGPVVVNVQGTDTPDLPQVSSMGTAYPNPFRTNGFTNIEVNLKQGDSGTVSIYNILGQMVQTYPVTQGIQTIQWNGRNGNGKLCGTGIYFYKLSTPLLNKTGKLVILK